MPGRQELPQHALQANTPLGLLSLSEPSALKSKTRSHPDAASAWGFMGGISEVIGWETVYTHNDL